MEKNKIYQGDCLEVMKTFPDESIQCCITSPPYWGLRDYGCDNQLGLESTPEEYVKNMVEVFREVKRILRKDGTCWLNLGDSYNGSGKAGKKDNNHFKNHTEFGKPAKNKDKIGIPTNVKGLKPKDLVGIPWRVAFALQQPYYTGKIKDEKDRIWLAAIIDGEGCLFIHKRKAGQSNGQGYFRKNDTYSAGLEVANTHMSIVQKCMDITGIGSICTVEKENKHKIRNLPLHRWNVRSNQCREIIKEIYPYLVGKQHEARLLLGCPSSGTDAEKAHYSLMALHNKREPNIDFKPPDSMYEEGFYLRQDIIWKKPNPMPESVTDRCTKSHEYIFLLSKSQQYYYDQDAIKEKCNSTDIKHPSYRPKYAERQQTGERFEGNGKYGKKAFQSIPLSGKNKRSVWTVTTRPFKKAHFATFPPKLIEPCILAGCPKGGIVLDPFMGAGTVGWVASENNRNYVGCELNQEYIKIAEQRILNAQPQLF